MTEPTPTSPPVSDLDLTELNVVRDRDGVLWTRDGRYWWSAAERRTRNQLARHRTPLTPVLYRDGRTVTTVGDLTARHVGKVVSIGGRRGRLATTPDYCRQKRGCDVWLKPVSGVGLGYWLDGLALDTPCEVIL